MADDSEKKIDPWRIKKDVSVADIVSFIAAASAVLYGYTTLDKRIALMENASIVQSGKDTTQDQDMLRLQARIDAQLQRIDDKLDRLIRERAR